MACLSLWLRFVVGFTVCLRLSSASCFKFLAEGSSVGHITPFEFDYVGEGTTLHIECSIDGAFAVRNGLSAQDVFFESPNFERLTPDLDSRVNVTLLVNNTAVLNIANITVADDGEYHCAVMLNGTNRRLCSIEVPVAGPPKKYLDFACESQNYLNLICTWKRSGYYTGRSKMQYKLTYRTAAGPGEYDCPLSTGNSREGLYKCEWNASLTKNPPIMLEYTHYITINGSNSFGSQVWTETVTPKEIVRPAAPVNLTITSSDATSCLLSWGIVTNLQGDFRRQMGLLTQIDIAKHDTVTHSLTPTSPTSHPWRTVTDSAEDLHFTLTNLNAFSNYSIRLRTHPRTTGYWSNYSTVQCTTLPASPGGDLGIVPGAYEEVGNGGQRRVTLYWQGIPEHFRNGPNFRYRLVERESDGSEVKELGETVFANYFIAAPANASLRVDVTPLNALGEGEMRTVVIPAVQDAPLMIVTAHVVKFEGGEGSQGGRYEVSWEVNRHAEVFDLFWCATSLKPHLAKCTDEMSHVAVGGDVRACNLTLSQEKEYRFAVAGRVGNLQSGMNWIARQCSSTDEHARLEGLTVTAVANASVELSWNTPCQRRFLHITGYRVYYYRCDVNTPKECLPDNYKDILKGTSVTLRNLQPGKRYCFLLMVLDDVNSTSPYVHKVEQCIRTTQLVPPLPMASIVGGSVAGAVFLVVVAFIVWRVIKRMRKDFKEIQKESRVINIPPALFDKYDDGYTNNDSTHYTKVDMDHPYTRQLSSVSGMSSSGHGGSITSESTSRISASDDTDGVEGTEGTEGTDGTDGAAFLTLTHQRVDIISGLNGTRLAGTRVVGEGSALGRVKHRHSTVDLDHLARNAHKNRLKMPDSVSLGSSESSLTTGGGGGGGGGKAKHRLRIRVPSSGLHLTSPSQKTSLVLTTNAQTPTGDSGQSDSQASSGYVSAVAVTGSGSGGHQLVKTQVSLGNATDTGYVSQQSTMSHSLDGSEASVFSELDSPMTTDGGGGGSGGKRSSLRDSLSCSEAGDGYGGSAGNLSLDPKQTSEGQRKSLPLEAGQRKSLPLEVEMVPVGSGYVAWP